MRNELRDDDAKIAALLTAARPTPDAAREAALLDRIVAAAERAPHLTVVASNGRPSVMAQAVPTLSTRRPRRDLWAATGLLAASLMLGVFIGQSPYSEQTVTRIEQATGFTLASASTDLARLLASAEHNEDD